MTPDELDLVLTTLKKHGVTKFKGMELEVNIGPERVALPGPDMPKKSLRELLDESGAGVCACGHDWLSHTDDGCLIGCGLDTCAPVGEMPQEPS